MFLPLRRGGRDAVIVCEKIGNKGLPRGVPADSAGIPIRNTAKDCRYAAGMRGLAHERMDAVLITYNEQDSTFTLDNGRICYSFSVVKGRYLAHRYFGRHVQRVTDAADPLYFGRAFCATPDTSDKTFSLDTLPREYPDFNQGDFRAPAYVLEASDKSRVTRFCYAGHRIVAGKPALEGLPAAYVEDPSEAETLIVTLADETLGAEIRLIYTIYRDLDVICRHVEVANVGACAAGGEGPRGALYIEQLASMSVDMPVGEYDVITMTGSHLLEKQIQRRRVTGDAVCAESIRGASSPQATPCVILTEPGTTEDAGGAWAFDLVYSGDFRAVCQRAQYGSVRVQLGMNPLTFGWTLGEDEVFVSPETVMTFSPAGLNGMSQNLHRLFRTRVCRGPWRDRARPVLLNSWEAFTFDIDEGKSVELAREAARLGMELYVLDDGWFKGRTGEGRALGDWVEDRGKFPRGLAAMADDVRAAGLGFGLWFEPEMVCPVSDLIDAHPDWVVRGPRCEPVQSRFQYVLDLSNPAVRDYLVDAVSRVLADTGAVYVKWDMNRHMTDLGSAYLPSGRQRELSHRYMLGLYDVLDRLTGAFPEVLFEGCSSGGGRFDAGMLYYMPQTWTSDDSDPVERLSIQYGTSLLFPPVTMGAHVSDVPNCETGRTTPLETRFNVAACANLGYELDIRALSEDEKRAVAEQVARYKELRETVQHGVFWRLENPQGGNDAAWCAVAEDGSRAVLMCARKLADPLMRVAPVRMRGLDPDADYVLEADGSVHGGDELMYAGLTPRFGRRDFDSRLYVFRRREGL